MITAIDIGNLRGVAAGTLEGLAPLTILTGPNGCGKSTVLDALLIAASPDPGGAVGNTVLRRPETRDGARWLVRGPLGEHAASLTITRDGAAAKTELRARRASKMVEGPPPYSEIASARPDLRMRSLFAADNTFLVADDKHPDAPQFSVKLIDPGLTTPLVTVFSEATRRGRRAEAFALLADLIPGFESLDILTEDDGTPALYTTLRGAAVPVGLAGDGVQSFIQLALELSALEGGLALIEEPEVYQHPRAIHQSAKVLLAAMRRKVQIVLSTHSLELIDALLDAASDADLEHIALFNLRLDGGQLRSCRYAGPDIAFNRDVVANDLR